MSDIETVRAAVAEALRQGHFYAAPMVRLEWEHVAAEETPWEVFRGQLVPPHLTRQTAMFEKWNIYVHQDGQRSDAPLLSVNLEPHSGLVHVVRGLFCWVWEGYHDGDNVYLSREVTRWVSELVVSIDRTTCSKPGELAQWVFRAVVGLSRLPLTSVEAPLPGFSLGVVAYFPDLANSRAAVVTSWRDLLECHRQDWQPNVRTKWLEFLLRTTPADEIPALAAALGQEHDVPRLLRCVLNEVALSPWTDFVDKTLQFLRHYRWSAAEHVDFLGYLLRQLARHLTAYDLVTFHHRGANYPDALMLDAALKEYLRLAEMHPELFHGEAACLRRRALRQAWVQRRRYEEYPVPDMPTSPGENMRILPAPHVRVPEEQIQNLGKRKRRLYHRDPLPAYVGPHARDILRLCGQDLVQPEELRELGMAIFIERPLAANKAPGEPDVSPLLAHEAFSRSLAERGLGELKREPWLEISADAVERCRQLLAQPWPVGGILARTLAAAGPQVVSLADAAKAAPDFILLRTLPASVRAFVSYDSSAKLGRNLDEGPWLIVAGIAATGQPTVIIARGADDRP